MISITAVRISSKHYKYLTRRKLEKQFEKQVSRINRGHPERTNLKKLKPSGDEIWSFRINKQFRALGQIKGDEFVIFDIDNHQ